MAVLPLYAAAIAAREAGFRLMAGGPTATCPVCSTDQPARTDGTPAVHHLLRKRRYGTSITACPGSYLTDEFDPAPRVEGGGA